MLLAIIQRNNNLSDNIPRGSNMHFGFLENMTYVIFLHIARADCRRAGLQRGYALRGGRSPQRLPASFSQQKGEPNQLTPGDRHPTPHRPASPLLCTPACIFLPPYAFRCSARPRTAPFPPVRVRIRSSASHPLIITSSLSLARSFRSSDRAPSHARFVPSADEEEELNQQAAGSAARWSVCSSCPSAYLLPS